MRCHVAGIAVLEEVKLPESIVDKWLGNKPRFYYF